MASISAQLQWETQYFMKAGNDDSNRILIFFVCNFVIFCGAMMIVVVMVVVVVLVVVVVVVHINSAGRFARLDIGWTFGEMIKWMSGLFSNSIRLQTRQLNGFEGFDVGCLNVISNQIKQIAYK